MAARAVIELVEQTLRATCRETGAVGQPVNRTGNIAVDERRALAMLSDACDCDDYHSTMEGVVETPQVMAQASPLDRTFEGCDRCGVKLKKEEVLTFRLRLDPSRSDAPGEFARGSGMFFCQIAPSDRCLCAKCAFEWQTKVRREAMIEAMRKFMERRP
jgi:hypothetical protein